MSSKADGGALGPSSGTPESIEEVLAHLRLSFQAEAIGDLQATYQIDLEGEGGGSFWARVDGGRLSCGEGGTPQPDVHFRLQARDFYDVLAERANPELLHVAGRIEVVGSLSLALKLRVMFLSGGTG